MRLTGASPDGWGSISADRQFLKALTELCDETGALLVFDEAVTGFRLGLGGAQQFYGRPATNRRTCRPLGDYGAPRLNQVQRRREIVYWWNGHRKCVIYGRESRYN